MDPLSRDFFVANIPLCSSSSFPPSITHKDRFTQHRYKADQAFLLSTSKSPVAAYLDIESIVKICKEQGVEAVHPGKSVISQYRLIFF